ENFLRPMPDARSNPRKIRGLEGSLHWHVACERQAVGLSADGEVPMRLRAILAFTAALPGAASASALGVEVFFAWGDGPTQNTTYDSSQLGEVDNGDGTFGYSGATSGTSGGWNLSWSVTAKEDPFIDGVFAVTNNTGTTQTYTIV